MLDIRRDIGEGRQACHAGGRPVDFYGIVPARNNKPVSIEMGFFIDRPEFRTI
jgi:hypothetical protein